MQPVYLICGVPGSGKTWVCRQMAHKAYYIPHDLHYKDHASVLINKSRTSIRPIITECPFAERVLREQLELHSIKVHPIFVVEDPEIIKKRYENRENKRIPKNNLTRAVSIVNRAKEWNAPMGTSTEVLKIMQGMFP
jgi:gluconate kinase